MLSPFKSLSQPSPADVPTDFLAFLVALGQPSIIECPGSHGGPSRAVVTLLHANEPSGARAIHAWLRSGKPAWCRSLLVIASVRTALSHPLLSHRMLDDQPDANRCFRPPFRGPIGEAAKHLLESLRNAHPEALIDLHNNTGENPPYGVGPGVTRPQLNLTRLFADRYMASDLTLGTLVEATAPEFASVTIECGRASDPLADATALAGLERFLALDDLSLSSHAADDLSVLARPIRVTLLSGKSLSFGSAPDPGSDLTLRPDVDRYNFEAIDVGTPIGWARDPRLPLSAKGADGTEMCHELFTLDGGQLRVRRAMVPIMMTLDWRVATRDCLFYAMLDSRSARSALSGSP